MRGLGRKRRAMFAVQGRAVRRRWSWPRKLGLWGVLATFVALLVLALGWPNVSPTTKAQITLKPQKQLFGIGERPVLQLRMAAGPHLGWLASKVFADTVPQATVDFDGNKTPETATVTPDADGYKVMLNDNSVQPTAGTYDVTVTGQTNTGQDFSQRASFTWGALAVNSDKSLYAPGETAQLQFGVVGSKGNTICNAPLQVTITDPDGQATGVPVSTSDSCKGDSYTNQPDYTASYQTKGAGTYTIVTTLQSAAFSVTDTFKVVPNAPFDVSRTSVTRLFPSHTYGMALTVHANQDFAGTVREELPTNQFRVSSSVPVATVSQPSGQPATLSWAVDWKAGGTYQLTYQFTPPLRSPAFYQIAPVVFSDTHDTAVFKEAKSWQYVGDATITVVKETMQSFNTAGPPNTSGNVSITSTTGDALILLFAQSASGSSDGISTVVDSATNTWVVPGSNPNQNPPENFSGSVASLIAMAYAVNTTGITTINVTTKGSSSAAFAFDLLEVSNIDSANPVDQSASTTDVAAGVQTTPTITATTCDSPTTAQFLRGGDYFCTSPNEFIVGIIQAGRSAYPTLNSASVPDNAGYPAGAPGWTATKDMPMRISGAPGTLCPAVSSCAAGAYQITGVGGSYDVEWTVTPNNAPNKAAAVAIMAFRQTGNTSGGDKQNLFWAR